MPSPNELRNWQPPEGIGDGAAAWWSGVAEGVRPDPDLGVAQWADEFRVLSTKSSAEAGRWSTARTPYLREVMDCLTPSHPMTDGVLQAGTQLGKSECLYNWIGYIIDQAPGPVMLMNPTTDMAKKISKQRIAPLIEESPVLRGKVREAKARSSGNTTLLKEFDGGLAALVGANSGPALRSMPIRYLMCDEVDAYPTDVDGEGDPVEVAVKRTDTFGVRAKRMYVSTPKLAGSSRIDRMRREGSGARYYVPCPYCTHEQYLRWPQMRWEMYERREMSCPECGGISEISPEADGEAMCHHCDTWVPLTGDNTRQAATDEVARAWYECEACGGEIGEHHKPSMLERGRWIHANVGPCEILEDDDPHPWALWAWVGKQVRRVLPRYVRPLSWHLPSLYSPLGWFAWSKAAAQHLRAKKGGVDETTGEPLEQVFANTVLAEAYEAKGGNKPKEDELRQRAEPYRLGQVPRECLLLAGSVDVQGDRIEAFCFGAGRNGERWVIDHQRIYGNTLDLGPGGPWAKLTAWRQTGFPHAGGSKLRMVTVAIDSGHHAHVVYTYCAAYRYQEVFAVKGASEMGKPILGLPKWVDINHDGRVMKNGAQLWMVGTDTAKEQIYRSLEGAEGYGTIHFPSGLPDEFFAQLTAEHVHRKRLNGRELRVWQLPVGKRNEILDLVVYASAALERAGVRRANWDHIESRVNPAMRDLFAPEPAPEPEPAAAQTDDVVNETVVAVLPEVSSTPATEDGPGAAAPVPPAVETPPAPVAPRKPAPPVLPHRRVTKPAVRTVRRAVPTW